MKPFRTFLFFLSVWAIMLILSILLSGRKWVLAGKVELKFPEIHFDKEFLNLNSLIVALEGNPDTLILDSFPEFPDSIGNQLPGVDSIAVVRKSKPGLELEYPEGDTTLLHSFFEKIQANDSAHRTIRVLYYGDSQIEGDRITAQLRKELQAYFGGMGAGLISPKMVVSYTQSVQVKSSSNWRRYGIRDYRDALLDHMQFGAMMNLCRFSLPGKYMPGRRQYEQGWVKADASDMGFFNAEKFEVCRIFIKNVSDTCFIECLAEGEPHQFDTIPPGSDFRVSDFRFNRFQTSVNLRFTSRLSPDILGISLEGKEGILVDNIPMRGSRGTDFSATDTILLGRMYEELNPGLIILHFGVNVAPNIVDSYSYYQNALVRELALLKRITNNTPIMVIGISDMNKKTPEGFVTYPNIKAIRDAQKNATFLTNCIFYDLFEAMGGENSMQKWVDSIPSLGKKDYIHFTYAGANKVAEMIFNVVENDYKQYKEAQSVGHRAQEEELNETF
ncbi:MAG: hypothetical protein U9N53_14055 [Bacteroidota bacterium]|nr:hypothetical protein [Bacteroidota bacterium]